MKVNEVMEAALQVRDLLEAEERRFKEKTDPLKEALWKAEVWLLQYLNDQGLQNVAVKGLGTAFKRKVTSVSCADWSAACAWMSANNRFDMLNHSVNKTVVQAHVDDTGQPPPGVNYTADVKVSINRARPEAKEEA